MSQTQVVEQSVSRFTALTFMNFVTPKATTKCELLFNKPASEEDLLSIQVRLKQHNKV
jgi:hypothetical protein